MTVVTVALRNEKALQLLQDLADLNLIELVSTAEVPTAAPLSSFIGKLNSGKSLAELDAELSTLRSELERTI